jgi:hypothetical protein
LFFATESLASTRPRTHKMKRRRDRDQHIVMHTNTTKTSLLVQTLSYEGRELIGY